MISKIPAKEIRRLLCEPYINPAANPTTHRTTTATVSKPISNVFPLAALAGATVVLALVLLVELATLEVPVVLTPLALLSATLLVLFGVARAEEVEDDEVLETAAGEVDIFVLVADAVTEVLIETGREVGAAEVAVEEAVV